MASLIDLSLLATACEWLGIKTTCLIDEDHNVIEIHSGLGPSWLWYGSEENAAVKEVLRVAIMARVDELVAAHNFAGVSGYCEPSHRIGAKFISAPIHKFTTSLAAQTVIDMYKAAQGEGA